MAMCAYEEYRMEVQSANELRMVHKRDNCGQQLHTTDEIAMKRVKTECEGESDDNSGEHSNVLKLCSDLLELLEPINTNAVKENGKYVDNADDESTLEIFAIYGQISKEMNENERSLIKKINNELLRRSEWIYEFIDSGYCIVLISYAEYASEGDVEEEELGMRIQEFANGFVYFINSEDESIRKLKDEWKMIIKSMCESIAFNWEGIDINIKWENEENESAN